MFQKGGISASFLLLHSAQHTTLQMTHTQYELRDRKILPVKFWLSLEVLNVLECFINKQNLSIVDSASCRPFYHSKFSSHVLHCPPPLSSLHHFVTGHSLITVMWVNSRKLNIFIFRRNVFRNHLLKYISEYWENFFQNPYHNP